MRQAARLRREAEATPPAALGPVLVRAMALTDELCWGSLERGDVAAFARQCACGAELREFCVGPQEPSSYDYHLKHMTTVGEPIEPEVWRWYHDEVGKGEAAVVDTWWMTGTGGFLGGTLPALQPMKPGSCGPGVREGPCRPAAHVVTSYVYEGDAAWAKDTDEFSIVGRFLPTSQTCSVCWVVDGPKALHVRGWTCRGRAGSAALCMTVTSMRRV